jgi:hypothetical protein
MFRAEYLSSNGRLLIDLFLLRELFLWSMERQKVLCFRNISLCYSVPVSTQSLKYHLWDSNPTSWTFHLWRNQQRQLFQFCSEKMLISSDILRFRHIFCSKNIWFVIIFIFLFDNFSNQISFICFFCLIIDYIKNIQYRKF